MIQVYTKKIEHYRDMPLWKLAYKLAEKEKRIIGLIKSGETNKSLSLRRTKYRKNLIYRSMLEKLKLWEKGELKIEYPTFADLNNLGEK